MDHIQTAFKKLKASLSKRRGRDKKSLKRIIDQTELHLDLLELTDLSDSSFEELRRDFRGPLAIVYGSLPELGLQFASSLVNYLYHFKILAEYTSGQLEQRKKWELTLNALLSGVLDYHDEHENADSKRIIATSLYHTLCSISFSLSMPFMSTALRCTAYGVLSDVAAGSKANQEMLRDSGYVGGAKIGTHILRTKDYLVLEALLNLFARILPSTNNTKAGRSARSTFVDSVFTVPFVDTGNERTGQEIIKVLETLRSSAWEPTAAKIISILAKYDLEYPQPFEVKEVLICDATRPVDTLYADRIGLCANVVVEDDQYESLEIPYSTIQRIDVIPMSEGAIIRISILLSSIPAIGSEPAINDAGQSVISAQFDIAKTSLSTFCDVMRNRQLGKHMKIQKIQKQSLSRAAANLELDSTVMLVGKDKRYETVSKLYETDEPNDELTINGCLSDYLPPHAPLTPPTSVLPVTHSSAKTAQAQPFGSAAAADSTNGLESTTADPLEKPDTMTVARDLEAEKNDVSGIEVHAKKSTKSAKVPVSETTLAFVPSHSDTVLKGTIKRRKIKQIISDDEIEDVISGPVLSVSRRRSTLNLAPTQRQSTKVKSDKNFRNVPSADVSHAISDQDILPAARTGAIASDCDLVGVDAGAKNLVAAKTDDMTNNNILGTENETYKNCSLEAVTLDDDSPATVPATKSIKKNLRKKNDSPAEATGKTKKRKLGGLAEETNTNGGNDSASGRLKRQRKEETTGGSVPVANVKLSGSRPKHYHAKRDSEVASVRVSKKIDFDQIPDDSSAKDVTQRSSSPLARKSAATVAPKRSEKVPLRKRKNQAQLRTKKSVDTWAATASVDLGDQHAKSSPDTTVARGSAEGHAPATLEIKVTGTDSGNLPKRSADLDLNPSKKSNEMPWLSANTRSASQLDLSEDEAKDVKVLLKDVKNGTLPDDLDAGNVNTPKRSLSVIAAEEDETLIQEVDMIDLTADDSPVKSKKNKPVIKREPQVFSPMTRPTALHYEYVPLHNSTAPQHGRPPASRQSHHPQLIETTFDSVRNAGVIKRHDSGDVSGREERPTTRRKGTVEAIASVLDEINEAIIRGLENKLGACEARVSGAKNKLLAAAANDLQYMNSARIERFNTLISLESEFASNTRHLNHSLEDAVKANGKACELVKKMIQMHNASANVKMPNSIFRVPFPNSVGKFRA